MRRLQIAAVALFAATGFAAAPAMADTAKPSEPAPQEVNSAAKPAKKYCVVDNVTGSRIARKTCATRDEWLAKGFDPLEAK